MKTKNSKAARTFLLPINDLLQMIKFWDQVVRSRFDLDDFWYPNLTTDGMDFLLDQKTGNSETRRIGFSRNLKRLCKLAKISYRSPHKIRNGHGVYAVKQAQNIEEFKAYSQNMMHENMQITDSLYGRLSRDEIKEVVTKTKDPIEEENYLLFQAFLQWQQENKF